MNKVCAVGFQSLNYSNDLNDLSTLQSSTQPRINPHKGFIS